MSIPSIYQVIMYILVLVIIHSNQIQFPSYAGYPLTIPFTGRKSISKTIQSIPQITPLRPISTSFAENLLHRLSAQNSVINRTIQIPLPDPNLTPISVNIHPSRNRLERPIRRIIKKSSSQIGNKRRPPIKIYGDGVESRFPPILELIVQRIQKLFSVYRFNDTSRPLTIHDTELEVDLTGNVEPSPLSAPSTSVVDYDQDQDQNHSQENQSYGIIIGPEDEYDHDIDNDEDQTEFDNIGDDYIVVGEERGNYNYNYTKQNISSNREDN